MKTKWFVLCSVLLWACSARGEILGVWSAGEALDADYTRYVLTMTPTEGEVMGTFDMRFATSVSGAFAYTSGTVFSTEVDSKTHFLLQETHLDEEEETFTDLITMDKSVTSKRLAAMFAATAGGLYDGGWNDPVAVAQVVIANASGVTPADFTYTLADGSGSYAVANIYKTGEMLPITFASVPEPGTFTLLGAALTGLVCYAWRKRRQGAA